MDTNQRRTQNGPSYSPRQMTQGDSGASQARPAGIDRQYQAQPAELPDEMDSLEWSACLGED